MRRYAEVVFDLTTQNRDLIRAAASRAGVGAGLQSAFSQLEAMAARVTAQTGTPFDAAVAVRAGFVMVVGTALFEAELFADRSSAGRDRIVAELGRIMAAALGPARSTTERVLA